MTDFTPEYLDSLLKRDTNDEIRETALSAKEAMAALDQENDLDQRRMLTERLMDDFALLRHLLDEWSRGGEDFVNDGVFHEKH